MINELITRSERVVASLYSVSASELAQFSPQSLTPKDLDSRAEFYSSCFESKCSDERWVEHSVVLCWDNQ
jgi:hypothetical protein